MSAKARFLKKLQEQHPRSRAFDSKSEADIAEFCMSEGIGLLDAMRESAVAATNSEARRAVEAGSVKINGEKVTDFKFSFECGEYIVQVGKRKFAKIKVTK